MIKIKNFHQNFFDRKFVMVAKSFPREMNQEIKIKNFWSKTFYGSK